ncbi:cobaltochelatase subunit CobN [Methanosarcina sp. KYL-1]|uniref:cobaltochelatase subunit CobN n=1 Tax=Methanosarcina sp. KYL-1 TaxID=2602068 RepID=UPI002101661E|nr:cobaltochelatase subunit CobN [Methanosarcina sp. KYL-1]
MHSIKCRLLVLSAVLLLLLAPNVSADENHVDIMYIGFSNEALAAASITNQYNDSINYTYLPGYDPSFTTVSPELLTARDSGLLESQDVIICDMLSAGIYSEVDSVFSNAHASGTTFISFRSDLHKDYLDYYYGGEEKNVTFCYYFNNMGKEYPQLRNAEKLLVHLARDYASCPEITDAWPTINITYIGFPNEGLDTASLTNQYSEFISYSFLPAYDSSFEDASPELLAARDSGFLESQDVIICDMFSDGIYSKVDGVFSNAHASGTTFISFRSDLHKDYLDYYYDSKDNSTFSNYFENMGKEYHLLENAEKLLIYLSKEYGNNTELTDGWELTGGSSVTIPSMGIYHNGSDVRYFSNLQEYLEWYSTASEGHRVYDRNKPTIGIWFHRDFIGEGNLEPVDALIGDIESKGCNVIAGFDTFDDVQDFYCDANGTPLVQCMISYKSFGLCQNNSRTPSAYEYGINQLKLLNVPVLKAIAVTESDVASDANRGIPSSAVSRETLGPDRDGIFEYIYIARNVKDETGVSHPRAIPSQINWIVNRSINWAELKLKGNQDKNVALIYYNYPPGKDNIGASYLNTVQSMQDLLVRMESDKDYTVRDLPENATELLDRIQSHGRNVGSWAPGELKVLVEAGIESGDMVFLPVETYRQWFESELPQELRDSVLEEWGTPWEGDLDPEKSPMIWENETGRYVVIPTVRYGNIWLMPQPSRGFMQNENAMYHSSILPPTHQYIAFYLWLNKNNEWQPDALVHVGTHGTHEWLPGSAYGMNRTGDWAPLLLQDLPNIYPYIVANVGEGLTAEYRGNALIIDHLTPTLERGGLHGKLGKLESDIQSYYKPGITDELRKSYWQSIISEMVELNLDVDLDVSESELEELKSNQTLFEVFLKNELHEYLEDISEENIPYGMHVLGENPEVRDIEVQRNSLCSLIRKIMGESFETNVTETFGPEASGKIDALLSEVIVNDTNPVNAQDIIFGSNSSSVTPDLEAGLTYRASLPEMKPGEMNSTLMKMLGPSYLDNLTGAFYSNVTEYPSGIPADDGRPDTLVWEVVVNCTKPIQAQDLVYGSKNSSVTLDLKKGLLYRDEILDLYRDEMSLMVRSMLGSSFEEAVTVFYSGPEYPLGMPADDRKVDWMVWELVSNNTTPVDAQDLVFGYNDSSVNSELEAGLEYRDSLAASAQEMDMVLSALEAGFIPPGPGRDPVLNPDSVPTGRNFYSVDPELYPSEAAWNLAVNLTNTLLVDYYNNHNGTFPSKVSFSRFGVEFIRDEGTVEAEILYLLGIKPEWDENGKVKKLTEANVMSDSEMYALLPKSLQDNMTAVGRPRIDIVYATAGIRDAFPDKIKMIDGAVKLANNATEGDYTNYVYENSQAIYEALNGTYDSETARKLSTMRCFAVRDGTYEIGVSNAIGASGTWDNEEDIANVYLDKMGYAYGEDFWGISCRDLLEGNLKTVDASVHSDSSNLYDTLDNDDFFQYFGGMNLATRYLSGKTPDMYVSDTRDREAGGCGMVSLDEYFNTNLRSRYLNEEWINGMKESGYAGGWMMSEFVNNLWGWEVCDPDLVDDSTWEMVYDTYINDPDMKEWFKENCPHAYQSITARMLETTRKENANGEKYWGADEEILNALINEYVKSVVEDGVTCCHHTCGNPLLDEYVKGMMSVAGVSQELQDAYNKKITEATDSPASTSTSSPSKRSSSGNRGSSTPVVMSANKTTAKETDAGYGTDTPDAPESSSSSKADPYVEGYEMQKEAVDGSEGGSSMSFSGADIVGALFVLACLGGIYLGFRKKKL